ncbi:MAG TPA: PAS domain S-box protein, partial [Roseiflexaceae bacterium]
MTDRTQHGAWRIPLLYALFASAWILFSDRLLDTLNADPLIVGELQTAKGWAFVAITAGLLYVLLRRDSRRVQRSKAALHETEQRYRRIVETTEEGIWMIDANDQTTFVNQKMADLLGYSAAEMIGAPLLAFMDAEGQAISEAALVRRRQGIREQLEAKFCRRDCTTLWALVATNPVEDDEGRYAGALAMVTDITERKRAEAALRASEQQLSLIFDTVGDVIFLLSVEPEDCFRFITMNSTGLALTGLAPEQVIGKRVEEVLPATAHALVIGKYKEAIRENKTVRWEEVSEYPTGTLCGEVAVTPASDTAGNGTHLIGSVHDITDIRRAEQALHRYAERLNVLHEIDLAILAARSAEEIAEAALGRVQQLIPCQRASLTIFDYEAEEAVVLVAQIDGETMVEPGTRFPLQEAEIPDQLRRGATHVIDDLSTLSMLSPMLQALCADGMRSHMAVPLLPLGELIGTLNLAAQDPGSFQPEDIDIACEIAAQLAVAIRGAQLYEAEQHARRFADTLHAANESLTRTLDLNSVLETLLDHLGQLVPYDSANVMLLTADACLAVHTTRGYERWTDPAKIRTISFDLSATPNLQTVLVTRKSLLI